MQSTVMRLIKLEITHVRSTTNTLEMIHIKMLLKISTTFLMT